MVTLEALESLKSHWAIKALDSALLERAEYVAKARLVKAVINERVHIEFQEEETDDAVLERVATAYEIAAAEGIDALISSSKDQEGLAAQAQAAAFKLFEFRRVFPLPEEPEPRIFHILHLAAVAYCGDRWAEQRRWFKENPDYSCLHVDPDTPWDRRLLYRLYECWVCLVRKNGWEDLNRISEIVAELRREQNSLEAELLKRAEETSSSRQVAFRLIALYNWARSTELLGVYMLQGEPVGIEEELNRHFEDARDAAMASGDMAFDVLLRWLHVAARRMVTGSIWTVARMVNSRITRFVKSVTQNGAMFELLPPQRAAIQREGLLDPAKRAIVVDMPTSGGKTALAEFRILQALNQFDGDNGWVAYVAPTRALVAQLTRRLRRDFGPLGVIVEQLSGAVDVDSFEEAMLQASEGQPVFHVLVSTPEKLQFVIRNRKTPRPLALLVLDEAHNIEDEERGLRIELLLATVKRDCPRASFLLLMPYVPNSGEIASWLGAEAGASISLSSAAWQPNDRVVGLYWVDHGTKRGDWSLKFETLTTSPHTIHLRGVHKVGENRPLAISYSKARISLTLQTAAMAKILSELGGTSIAVARTISDSWAMARTVADRLEPLPVSEEIRLVQRFLAQEVSPHFELIQMLEKGVGVHHAGLSDEARSLIEWLVENNKLRVLCATTTIAQGINFPVSSVFLASRSLPGPRSRDMSTRSFWNLAGRAGRIEQGSLGVVGIAAGDNPGAVRRYVSERTGDLISRLQVLLDELYTQGQLANLELVIQDEQWSDFRSYIAHLWSEKRDLDTVLAEAEQVLRNTFGYSRLRQNREDFPAQLKVRSLLDATRAYARKLAEHPENAILADATGFAPEGVRSALLGLNALDRKLTPKDWAPASLFGVAGKGVFRELVGVMMRVPELRGAFEELGSSGLDHRRIADLTHAWVHGESLENIAIRYFHGSTDNPVQLTASISEACRSIYRYLTNFGTWGLASLSKMPTSGLNFESMTLEERRRINVLPAMIYYGVRTEAAILMRMQSVPRSIAEDLGQAFISRGGAVDQPDSPRQARDFVSALSDKDWVELAKSKQNMSGEDYKRVWSLLAGV